MSRLRWWIYKAGFRPSRRSIFFSPSLAFRFLLTDEEQ